MKLVGNRRHNILLHLVENWNFDNEHFVGSTGNGLNNNLQLDIDCNIGDDDNRAISIVFKVLDFFDLKLLA